MLSFNLKLEEGIHHARRYHAARFRERGGNLVALFWTGGEANGWRGEDRGQRPVGESGEATIQLPASYYQQFDADPTLDVPAEGYGGWKRAEIEISRPHTAVVVMHAWDCGTQAEYPGWYRCVESIPRCNAICKDVFPRLLGTVREHGVRLIHVVGGGNYYKKLPGYQTARELAGESPPPLERIKSDACLDRLRRFRSEHVWVGAE